MARSALDLVQATAAPINAAGAPWFFAPATIERGTAVGFPNVVVLYGRGRGGVLGEVDADVVAAAFGYFNPTRVRDLWDQGRAVMEARAAGDHYAASCAAFYRDKLASFAGAARLAELSETVVTAVEPCGLPLFAAWRAQPLSDDAPARAGQLLQVMRELRGSVHIVATTSVGLSPMQAILANPKAGPARAAFFGWPEPYPDPVPNADRFPRAEAITDELLVPSHQVLVDAGSGDEFADLVLAAHGVITG